MRRILFIAMPVGVLLSSVMWADEGRIPIFQPTTISQPGHYVVTRNISSVLTVVRIASDDVVLDLNGHTLAGDTSGCSGGDVIVIDGAAGARDVVIRNGHLVKGCEGISVVGGAGRLRIEEVEIEGSGSFSIFATGLESLDVVGCYLHDAAGGMFVSGSTASFGGRILNNKIERVIDYPMYLSGLYNGEVRGNLVSDYGPSSGNVPGITLSGSAAWQSGGNLVAGNTVSSLPSGDDEDGIIIEAFSNHNYLVGNVVRGNGRFGIWSIADGTRLEGNVTSANRSHGLYIGNPPHGLRNHLDRNQSQDNGGCGVFFANGTTHAYSNNNVRGNAGGGVCGLANTDAGGNIF